MSTFAELYPAQYPGMPPAAKSNTTRVYPSCAAERISTRRPAGVPCTMPVFWSTLPAKGAVVAVVGGAVVLVVVSTWVVVGTVVIVGAVHITQALAPMAHSVGFDVAVVDPRSAFAAAERFPGARLFADWPEVVFPELRPDSFTAVAALTHDPRIDDVALRLALDAPCFYVGALGSRRTHAGRVERLAAAGLSAERLSALRAPIGLDIGAATPSEIAVAILAEVIAARRALKAGAAA